MPTYDITVRGAVRDVGFRDLVESLGRAHRLPGYVYNESADRVRIVTRGAPDEVDAFVRGIHDESERAGIPVANIERDKTDQSFPVPSTFFKAPTDELSDIGRKLDRGIWVLRDIKGDTAAIKGDRAAIKGDTAGIKDDTADIKEDTADIRGIKSGTDRLVDGQRELIQLLDERL